MGRKEIDLMDRVFGRLKVVGRGNSRPQGGGVALWICKCECGNTVNIPGARLRQGSTKSCGCFRRDRAGEVFKSHGKSKTMEYCMFYDARKRAYALNLPFSIIPTDIHIPTNCPVLGIELTLKGVRDTRPSLDRVIPSKGYTVENIAVISFKANRIKSDATVAELKSIVNYIEDHESAIP